MYLISDIRQSHFPVEPAPPQIEGHQCNQCGQRWPCDTIQLADRVEELEDVLEELVGVATLRGDNELPHPADDPKLWTARMQTAWDEAERVVRADSAREVSIDRIAAISKYSSTQEESPWSSRGWLKRELEEVDREVEQWPDWMKDAAKLNANSAQEER